MATLRSHICVQGLGFVGLAMATVLANVIDEGQPKFKVTGVDLPSKKSLLDLINNGELPFESEDSTFLPLLKRAVLEYKNLIATDNPEVYSTAEVVIVDVHLDILKTDVNDYSQFELKKSGFVEAIRNLGTRIQPHCLVIVETTVPPGFCEKVVYPILLEEFGKRDIASTPLLGHSYERVMPGKDYLKSIHSFFRTYSGIDSQSRYKTREFLESFIDTNNFPLWEEQSPSASELAKVLENSYRAVNIAFIQEWTLLSEKMGVNLFHVIDGIRQRHTHMNIMKPGPGVGGYCLTKDSLLAQWSSNNLFDNQVDLTYSKAALRTNDLMPLHLVSLIKNKGSMKGKKVLLLGISYREDVGDSRFSPTEVIATKITKEGAIVKAYDPYIKVWPEYPKLELLTSVKAISNFSPDIIVFITRHRDFLNLTIDMLMDICPKGSYVLDGFDILNDEKIFFLLNNDREVAGVGKGHINRMRVNVK